MNATSFTYNHLRWYSQFLMRTVDLIHRKRDGEELSPDEIATLVDGYTSGTIPDYQMSAFLMAVFFANMTDREVSALTDRMVKSGETIDLSAVPGVKVDKHSTGGVGDKTSLIAAPLAAAAGAVVPMVSGRALGHTGGTLDKLESIPGFRTNLTIDEFREQLLKHKLAFMGQSPQVAPADGKFYALRDSTATVESIPLIASSIMSKKLAEGMDALVLDVKVGSGAFMKRQLDARRLAQMMVGIGRRLDKRVQALITDMNQPLGFAIGNALEVMEVSQTLQNVGPTDLTRLSLELASRMIFLGKIAPTLEEAREIAQKKLLDGSGYRKLKEVITAQGGNPQVLDRFELLPNATGAREITSPRAGYISAIDAEYIGQASAMIGAGRDTKEDSIDPAVGVILEVKIGQKVDAGGVLCRLYYTSDQNVEEAAQLVEDAFRISGAAPEERELILEVVG
jgi:pyrimidine-nucleoside phosphorylase